MKKTVKELFERKFTRGGSDECWLWLAYKDQHGFGRMTIDNTPKLAHRLSYQLYIGNIPDGDYVLHTCKNNNCVNPSHLFTGSNKEKNAEFAKKNRTLRERFEEKYVKGSIDQCWEWNANKLPKGYGMIGAGGRLNRRQAYAHRVAYQLYVGEIPKGMLVCHRCDNPSCVNPTHLFLGTQKDNIQDCVKKGRNKNGNSKGEKNGRAKLTVEDVLVIRASTLTSKKLALEYGVTAENIGLVRRGITWKCVSKGN